MVATGQVPIPLGGAIQWRSFLLRSAYTLQGIKGLVNDGGTKRAEVVRKTIEAAGGQVEALYFGFGDHDTYVLCDLPDHKAAAGLAIAIRAAGGVDTKITPVLTPKEVDEATRQKAEYEPPADDHRVRPAPIVGAGRTRCGVSSEPLLRLRQCDGNQLPLRYCPST